MKKKKKKQTPSQFRECLHRGAQGVITFILVSKSVILHMQAASLWTESYKLFFQPLKQKVLKDSKHTTIPSWAGMEAQDMPVRLPQL